jgi:hypothetical protein
VHAKKKAFALVSNPVGQYLKFDVHEYVGNEPNVVSTPFVPESRDTGYSYKAKDARKRQKLDVPDGTLKQLSAFTSAQSA